MPASKPALCCEPPPAPCRPPYVAARRGRQAPRRRLGPDTAAVSEIIGQILAFAIVVAVFLIAMFAFAAAQQGTQDRVVQLRADSAATRVAAAVVQAGILTEEHGTGIRLSLLIDLPSDIEGRDYTVALQPAAAGKTATVLVSVPARLVNATAPLLAIEAAQVPICAATVHGGHVRVRFADPPGSPGTPCIFLEAAP